MFSQQKTGELKEVRKIIQHHIDEIEVKIKNSKQYWHNCEFNFDKKFVLTFIDHHYNEIIHHLAEIKHHLEEINYHKKDLEDFKAQFVIKSPDQPKPIQEPPITIKRICEDKQKFKNLRASRCSSSKYVFQWEKIINEHKENPLNEIKRRPKSGAKPKPETSEDISNTMVKSRVMLFEKNKKAKRASSTIDAFLDFCIEKNPKGASCPSLDDICETPESPRPKSCDFETKIGDNIDIFDVNTLKINFDKPLDEKLIEEPVKCLSEDIFVSCLDIHSTEDKHGQSLEENEDKSVEKITKQKGQKCPEPNLSEDNCTKGNSSQESAKDMFKSCTNFPEKVEIGKNKKMEEKESEDKHKKEELSKGKQMKDIVNDKSVVTESKLELLDDVNALIEDDHLKIVKEVKRTGKKIVNDTNPQKEERKASLSKEEASVCESHDEEKEKSSKNVSTKPRIIELHIKKNMAPDVYF